MGVKRRGVNTYLVYEKIASVDVATAADVEMGDEPSSNKPLLEQILEHLTQLCLKAVKEQPAPIYGHSPRREETGAAAGSTALLPAPAVPPNGTSNAATTSEKSSPSGEPRVPPLQTPQGLRFLLLLLFHPNITDPDSYQTLNRAFRVFRVLCPTQKEILAEFFASISADRFRDVVATLQQ